MYFSALIVAAILLLALLLYYRTYFKYKKRLTKIPEVDNLPLVGCAYRVRNSVDVHNLLLEYRTKYGRVFWGMVGFMPMLFVTDPKLTQLLLTSTKYINKTKIYKVFRNWLGNSLFCSNGDEWRFQRRMLNPVFDFNNLKTYVQTFNRHSGELVKQLEGELDKESFDIFPHATLWSLTQVYDTMLGVTNSKEEDRRHFLDNMMQVFKIIMKRMFRPNEFSDILYPLSPDYWIEKNLLKDVHGYIDNIIETKKKEANVDKNNPDVIAKKPSFLLDILWSNMKTSKEVDGKFIKDQVNVMVGGGFPTGAISVACTLHLLAQNPKCQQKAYEEISTILGDSKDISLDQLQDMTYLDLVVKESLRIHTIIPGYQRQIHEDLEYDGIKLPKGLMVVLLNYVRHLDPIYFPEPEKFIPERFLSEHMKDQSKFCYTPFSAGIRNCIGYKYALLSMKIAIAKVLLTYEIVDVKHELVKAFEIGLILKTGVKVALKKRVINTNKSCAL